MDTQQQRHLRRQQESAPVSGVASWGRWAFTGVTGFFLVALAVQVFLAGMSIFVGATWWQVHMMMAYFLEWLPIVMMALAWVGRLPWAFALVSLLLLGQIMLQYMFIEIGRETGAHWIAAFHPVNALVMFAVGLILLRKALSVLGEERR